MRALGHRSRRFRSGAVSLALGVALLGACSTGGSSGGDLGGIKQPANNRVLCGLIASLPDAGSALQTADVRDPAKFTQALNAAVTAYVATLDDIAGRVDNSLKTTVADVRRLVLAHRFADAIDARIQLDTWIADHC